MCSNSPSSRPAECRDAGREHVCVCACECMRVFSVGMPDLFCGCISGWKCALNMYCVCLSVCHIFVCVCVSMCVCDVLTM